MALGEQDRRIARALLVHGAGGGGWEWDMWCRVMRAHGMACHAPDLEPSRAGLESTRLADYIAQVRDALERLPRPRAVIGASLGGLLAIAAADLADALVLVNPLPPAPWAAALPSREWPDVVPWHREARFDSTRRALADADEATHLYAFRRWRDESGAVLREAQAGIALPTPACRSLCIASNADADVPAELTRDLAATWQASCLRVDASHVGALVGRYAAVIARQTAGWRPPGGRLAVGRLNIPARAARIQLGFAAARRSCAHAIPARSQP
jgi:predicted alpha/beta hydrolase family esterase